jgi:SHS2 domain-containing protein
LPNLIRVSLMKRYIFLDHPADLKIKSFGENKRELFLNMLLGMSDFQRAEIEPGENCVRRKIEVRSADEKSLLVDFLNECLYLSSVNKEVYNAADFEEFGETYLTGILEGEKAAGFGGEIKAATHHDVIIAKKKGRIWEAVVLLDV